ncbi:sulfite exporter TauE/SafE family protein [Pseudobacteroides cellulosolvens]|uniref:Urease accessory protein UreH-like transmembrane domain-containing protein n=1 Tax=Pseudobacteroides cellulosolvens ATCC 35603 = DSM 2933 TaxID=398512 RepID=A0A0L6JRX8_9FIRM|nr:sulfite exporter TauE/SafE family protein [Pseudobacteroides cellulosolvens]KNY28147.1 hypothetical protein Bccel_3418 [Pseudobacteroides cellulosolvens ATCC 35603 = DSM 2933]
MDNILSNYASPFLTAIAVGFSCGAGCSPVVALFLTTYIMGNSKNVKKGLLSFLYFFFGKTSVIIILALLSALFGGAVLGDSGKLAGISTTLVLDIFLILTGLILAVKTLIPKKKSGCSDSCGKNSLSSGCNSCKSHLNPPKSKNGFAVFAIGAAYGITPCPPLLMVLALASLAGAFSSIAIASLFSIASSVSPLIVLAALAGFFSKKMHNEIPELIKVFQLLSFVVFIIAGIISLYLHLS